MDAAISSGEGLPVGNKERRPPSRPRRPPFPPPEVKSGFFAAGPARTLAPPTSGPEEPPALLSPLKQPFYGLQQIPWVGLRFPPPYPRKTVPDRVPLARSPSLAVEGLSFLRRSRKRRRLDGKRNAYEISFAGGRIIIEPWCSLPPPLLFSPRSISGKKEVKANSSFRSSRPSFFSLLWSSHWTQTPPLFWPSIPRQSSIALPSAVERRFFYGMRPPPRLARQGWKGHRASPVASNSVPSSPLRPAVKSPQLGVPSPRATRASTYAVRAFGEASTLRGG